MNKKLLLCTILFWLSLSFMWCYIYVSILKIKDGMLIGIVTGMSIAMPWIPVIYLALKNDKKNK